MSSITFNYRGEPIENIHEWCKSRNERVIRYRNTRQIMNPYSAEIRIEITEGEMPETFWNALRIQPQDGIYEEIK